MSEETTVEITPKIGVTASKTEAIGPQRQWLFIYAPGGGSNIHDPFGAFACDWLSEQGITAVRFQFPYMESRRRFPDRQVMLEETWSRMIDTFHDPALKMVVGGRSMGGRVASHVVAREANVDALALFAYPLHPPRDVLKVRDEHFPHIQAPTILCSGDRDAFASSDQLKDAARKIPNASVHILAGAGHGFDVKKSSGRTREEVWHEAIEAMFGWLTQLA